MANPTIAPEELWQRLLNKDVHIVDVRAPIEFTAGSIPLSVNHPILNDQERALVGTTYKQEGSEKAVALGHKLIQGDVKSARVNAWLNEVQKDPKKTVVTCFRGGMRSQITQTWLAEQGVVVPRVAGGYKKMRQFLMDQLVLFCESQKLIVLTGKTGAGKTRLLSQVTSYPVVDLEALAKHRGSAFGAQSAVQPAQIDFEHLLILELGRLQREYPNTPVLVEDESRLIGRCVQPEVFFKLLRSSPVIILDEPLDVRVENIFQEYVLERSSDPNLFSNFKASLTKINSKLGGLRYSEIMADINSAEQAFRNHGDISLSRIWIEKLVSWYYDPLYQHSFDKRNPEILRINPFF